MSDQSPGQPRGPTPFHRPGEELPAVGLAPLLNNALSRPSRPLHGAWSVIIDQANLGETNPMTQGGVGRGEHHDPSELLEYSFEGGDTLEVPGDWNTQKPELFWYRGVVWYRKDFNHNLVPDQRTYLYFGGANFRKAIYLNGSLLARHAGGFTPFNIDISDHLRDGPNCLIVKVDSLSTAADVPTEFNDWLNYGGITREVLLIDLPRTFIRTVTAQLVALSKKRLRFRVDLDGKAVSNKKIQVVVKELDIDETLKSDEDGVIEFDIEAHPRLWTPEDPVRYRVEVRTASDYWADDIGFRTLTVFDSKILLNGEPIYLNGISLHEEKLSRPGRAWGLEDASAVIREVRALGANFLRLAHYPHNEYMVRACDAAGLLVWSELPVYHAIDFANPATLKSARQQFAEIIERDANRAAIMFWSVANETEPGEERNKFLSKLARQVKKLDPTRLVTAALHGSDDVRRISEKIAKRLFSQDVDAKRSPLKIKIDDPLDEILDVVGYNQYFGWYSCAPLTRELKRKGLDVSEAQIREFMLSQMPLIRFEAASGKPIVISEFGAEALQGRRAEHLDIYSEDYQSLLYRTQLDMLSRSPSIRGISPWVLKDFRSPYRLHTRLQQYWNRKGLISDEGVRKLAFHTLSDYYRKRDEK